jgi:hypothetical protein
MEFIVSRRDRKRADRLPPFVPLLKDTLDSSAWRAMSHGAKVLYVSLKARYNSGQHNNGRIFLSQRAASREVGSGFNEIARWFRELQHYGFIVMISPGCLGVDGKGKAPHWRLTECGYMNDPPTRDFVRWDGTKFRDTVRPKKQNPVTEIHNTSLRKSVTPSLWKSITPTTQSVTENRNIPEHCSVTENHNVSSMPLPVPQKGKPLIPAFAATAARSRSAPPASDPWQDLEIPAYLRRH